MVKTIRIEIEITISFSYSGHYFKVVGSEVFGQDRTADKINALIKINSFQIVHYRVRGSNELLLEVQFNLVLGEFLS